MDAYVEEIETILSHLRQLQAIDRGRGETAATIYPSKTSLLNERARPVVETIAECQQDDRASHPPDSPLKSSGVFQIRLKDRHGKPGIQLQVAQLVELNHQLSDENEYLEEKLKEAEDYIHKLDGQRSLLIKEVEHLRNSSTRIIYEKDPVFFRLNVQIERLKTELIETSEFIVKNNQEFVEEIQRYNQSIWKLQHEVETLKASVEEASDTIKYQQTAIEQLKRSDAKLLLQAPSSILGYPSKQKRATSRQPGQETERIQSRHGLSRMKQYPAMKDRNEITMKRKLSPQQRP